MLSAWKKKLLVQLQPRAVNDITSNALCPHSPYCSRSCPPSKSAGGFPYNKWSHPKSPEQHLNCPPDCSYCLKLWGQPAKNQYLKNVTDKLDLTEDLEKCGFFSDSSGVTSLATPAQTPTQASTPTRYSSIV